MATETLTLDYAANVLMPSMSKSVNTLLKGESPSEQKIKGITEQLEQMEQDDDTPAAVKTALAGALHDLQAANDAGKNEDRRTIAAAVVHVCRQLKIPVAMQSVQPVAGVQRGPGRPAGSGGSRRRASKEAIEGGLSQVRRTLNKSDWTPASELKAAVLAASPSINWQSFAQKLHKDGIATTNGERGSNAAWKLLEG